MQVDLRVPLGMVIEETEKDHPYPGRVVVTGALPGYSAIGQVLGRGVIRELKACLSVACKEASRLQLLCNTPACNTPPARWRWATTCVGSPRTGRSRPG